MKELIKSFVPDSIRRGTIGSIEPSVGDRHHKQHLYRIVYARVCKF